MRNALFKRLRTNDVKIDAGHLPLEWDNVQVMRGDRGISEQNIFVCNQTAARLSAF